MSYNELLADIERMTQDKERWVDYDNGNYHVWIDSVNGTKIRLSCDDEYLPVRPESMDVKITNQCDMNCPFCHEDSRRDGQHADIEQAFVESLDPHTEIALGGGNVLSHPQLEELLIKLNEKQALVSVTLNQRHFVEHFEYVKNLYYRGLVKGIGVSLVDARDEKLAGMMRMLPTSVLHTIVGCLTMDDIEALGGQGIKILLLGYKNMRRGSRYLGAHGDEIQRNMHVLEQNLDMLKDSFAVVSFDNLALEQLHVSEKMAAGIWDSFYMGDDGTHTFYIDMVKREFAKSSTAAVRHDMRDMSIREMFGVILKSDKLASLA